MVRGVGVVEWEQGGMGVWLIGDREGWGWGRVGVWCEGYM